MTEGTDDTEGQEIAPAEDLAEIQADDQAMDLGGDGAQYLRVLEAVLFAADGPVPERSLVARLPAGVDVPALLERLRGDYEGRGVVLVQAGGAWAFRTAPDMEAYLTRERTVARKMSRAALETLAIIAYHQPITRAEIEEIRGVGLSKGTLDVLFEEGGIRPRGRRRTPGRPVTWGTTDGFLAHFGLESLRDLPGVEDLKAAGLLDKRAAIDVYRVTGTLGDPEAEDEDLEEDAIDSPLSEVLDAVDDDLPEPLDPDGDEPSETPV